MINDVDESLINDDTGVDNNDVDRFGSFIN